MSAVAPVGSYAVDLLYESAPLWTREEVIRALAERCGAVEPVSPDEKVLHFRFPDIRVPRAGKETPVQCALAVQGKAIDARDVESAFAQTRDWGEARAVVEGHLASVGVTDVLAAGLPYKNRLRLFLDVLHGLMDLAGPLAILWRPAGKFVRPLALPASIKPGDPQDAVRTVVGTRRLKAGGVKVVDTLGLAALGIPDLECLPGERPALPVEGLLLALARYVFDLGDVLAEGRGIKGPDGRERWVCRRGRSTAGPDRPVVRVGPE
jgi:hypothetical protein